MRELANLLERLAILFPDQTIAAADLPDRYRTVGAVGWFGTGVRVGKPAAAEAPLVELLEADAPAGEDQAGAEMSSIELDSCGGRAEELSLRAVSAEPEDLAELMGLTLPEGGIDLKDHLSAIEIGLIRRALEEADGTVAEAARLLRIRRTTLVEKLRKYRLSA